MKKFDSINVIPFIDIMLVLLAIVLATASFINQGKIKVDVPKSSSELPLNSDDLAHIITISSDHFYYNDEMLTLAELENKLTPLAHESKITIKIDAQTPFQKFVQVTDILTSLRLANLNVITQKNEHHLPTP